MGILKKLGLKADTVANGLEAIKALEMIDYDLVLMDVQMPDMDGLEATKRIRTSKSVLNPNIPIIAMTAHAMQGDREKCLSAGMDDYISKPVSPKAMAEKMELWLPSKEMPKAQQKESMTDMSPTVAPTQIAVFDRAGFLDRVMGDEEIAEKIVDVFLDDIPKQIESLKQALDVCDAETFHRIVHGIKGAAANVGGETLRNLAAEIEIACKNGHFETLTSCCSELEHQFDQLKQEIKKTANTSKN
jgi:CheY-like chemotaxis protein